MLALADLPILLSRVYWETKQLGGETDHTILSDEVKNAYSCTFPLTYDFMTFIGHLLTLLELFDPEQKDTQIL